MNALTHRTVLTILVAMLLAAPATAQQEPDEESAGNALSVIIKTVKGLVQVREGDDAKWQRAKPGMELGQGAEFRTGPRSAVEFNIPPDQTIVLDRLGTMKVLQAIENAGMVKTDLGVKYGRTKYKIETGGGLEHESTIRSPNATLAVRGTEVVMSNFAGFQPTARWVEAGSHKQQKARKAAVFESNGTQTVFGGGGADAEVTGDQNAAETANQETQLGGQQEQQQQQQQQQEQQQIQAQEQSVQLLTRAQRRLLPPIFRETDNINAPLSWTAPIADLDIRADVTLSNDVVTRIGSQADATRNIATRSFTGLEVPFDNTGSPGGGQEVLRSDPTRGLPVGVYRFSVEHVAETGPVPVDFTLDMQVNGQSIPVQPFAGQVAPGATTGQFTITVPEQGAAFVGPPAAPFL